MSILAYRIMAKVVDESTNDRAYEAAMTLCIALKIGVNFTEDMAVCETTRYLVKEELKDWGDDAYLATRKAISRIAVKVLDDMADDFINGIVR